jgi:rod shape-determining protein MreD
VQKVKIVIVLVILLVLQMILPKYLGFFRYIELPLLGTIFFGLMRSPLQGMWTGALAGLGKDIINGIDVLGINGFSKTLIGYCLGRASLTFPLENPLARLGIVALASFTDTIIVVGFNIILEQSIPVGAWYDFGRRVGFKVLGDTLTSIPLFMILNRLFPEQKEAGRMAVRKRYYG